MLNTCANLFTQNLDSKKLNYRSGKNGNGDSVVEFPYEGKIARMFFCGEEGNYLSIYLVYEKVPDNKVSDMIFTCAQIISDLSRHFTLQPGDLIFTGTPQGVMHGYPADKKNWLKPGDEVEVTIEGIGTLRNTFC